MDQEMTLMQRFSISIGRLIFEFTGTMLFTMLFITNDDFPLCLGLWIICIFARRVSGALLNPAITIAYTMRREENVIKKMHVSLAMMYIVSQIFGAWVGAELMAFFNWAIVDIQPTETKYIGTAVTQEVFGTFFLVMFYLMLAEERMKFSNEQVINCFIIASSYIGSRAIFNGSSEQFSYYGSCLNPAIAIGITLASIISNGAESFKWIWLYPLCPFIGALLAFLFYEFIYKKTVILISSRTNTDDLLNEKEAAVDESEVVNIQGVYD